MIEENHLKKNVRDIGGKMVMSIGFVEIKRIKNGKKIQIVEKRVDF